MKVAQTEFSVPINVWGSFRECCEDAGITAEEGAAALILFYSDVDMECLVQMFEKENGWDILPGWVTEILKKIGKNKNKRNILTA